MNVRVDESDVVDDEMEIGFDLLCFKLCKSVDFGQG